MACTRGMDEPDADFPGVPIGDVRFLPEFPRTGESFADALEVVAKPVWPIPRLMDTINEW